MKIFNKEQEITKEVGSELLRKRSKSVLDVFSQTINSLTQIVTEAKDQADQRQKEIEAATLEKQNLEQLAASNEKVITKIQAIIAPDNEVQGQS
jgi:predicted site-specific integrase-resolvase